MTGRGRPLMNDLTGERYGRLFVVGRSENRGKKVYWHCVCDCGGETDVQTFDLIFGKVRSCSCYRRDRQIEIYKVRQKIGRHRMSAKKVSFIGMLMFNQGTPPQGRH